MNNNIKKEIYEIETTQKKQLYKESNETKTWER
jgi:hypothetical protein